MEKRRRGRPAIGRDPSVTVKFPLPVIAAVENWAHANIRSYSGVWREAVLHGAQTRFNVTMAVVIEKQRPREYKARRRKQSFFDFGDATDSLYPDVTILIPQTVLATVEIYARDQGLQRAAALRELVMDGLRAMKIVQCNNSGS